MELIDNKGFEPAEIKTYKSKIALAGKSFVVVDSDENNDEYRHVCFIGKYEGREVVYDAVIYTLRMQHQSELFEIAEHKAAQHFPDYKKIIYQEDENGNLEPLDELEEEIGLFMADVIMEMEEEGNVKVQEHVELDDKADFGIGMAAGLHVEKITDKVIEKLIREFNDDTLELDSSLVTFQTQAEED